jgi:hypothetical protein
MAVLFREKRLHYTSGVEMLPGVGSPPGKGTKRNRGAIIRGEVHSVDCFGSLLKVGPPVGASPIKVRHGARGRTDSEVLNVKPQAPAGVSSELDIR